MCISLLIPPFIPSSLSLLSLQVYIVCLFLQLSHHKNMKGKKKKKPSPSKKKKKNDSRKEKTREGAVVVIQKVKLWLVPSETVYKLKN